MATAMLAGCSYSTVWTQCGNGAGGGGSSLRVGSALDLTVPICQPGVATVSSDPSQGVAALGRTLGIIERLVAPGAAP